MNITSPFSSRRRHEIKRPLMVGGNILQEKSHEGNKAMKRDKKNYQINGHNGPIL